jgi:hypothetical protein
MPQQAYWVEISWSAYKSYRSWAMFLC